MQDLGLKKEQAQQHRLSQPTLEQRQIEVPSTMQLTGGATSGDATILPPSHRGHVSSAPCCPSIGNSNKEEGM